MRNKTTVIMLWICSTLNINAQDFSGLAINACTGAPVYVYGEVIVKNPALSSSQQLVQTMDRINANMRAHSDKVWSQAAASRTQMLINEQNYLLQKIANP
jgi:hypothetical protein